MLVTQRQVRILSILVALLGVWLLVSAAEATLGKHYFKGAAGRYFYKATRAVASTDRITPVSIGACGQPPAMEVPPPLDTGEPVAANVVPALLFLLASSPTRPRSPPIG